VRGAVLADTGPLYASTDSDDDHHERARRQIKKLAEEKREVLITYPTLLEAYSLVLFKLGNRQASPWLEDVMGASLIHPTSDDYRLAAARVQSFADQPITFFDALLATMAMRLGLPVWTYDHHFDLMRVSVWR
jgi:predicted nucleic acid-binding protein